jgi:hypothetical protein
MLCKQNSAAMFLTHGSPASLLDGCSRRIRIEQKFCRGSGLVTHYSTAPKSTKHDKLICEMSRNRPVGPSLEVIDDDDDDEKHEFNDKPV